MGRRSPPHVRLGRPRTTEARWKLGMWPPWTVHLPGSTLAGVVNGTVLFSEEATLLGSTVVDVGPAAGERCRTPGRLRRNSGFRG